MSNEKKKQILIESFYMKLFILGWEGVYAFLLLIPFASLGLFFINRQFCVTSQCVTGLATLYELLYMILLF